jgi:transcriptional regulator with XRE-family HTH domain
MSNEAQPESVRPTDLAEKLGVSVPYASQLLSGARVPKLELALDMYDRSGVKLGPLKDKTDEQIATLRSALAA